MIFVFHTPVQIVKRKAVLTLDTDKLGAVWAPRLNGTVEFNWVNQTVIVPLTNIRYWRTNHDNSKQAPKQEV